MLNKYVKFIFLVLNLRPFSEGHDNYFRAEISYSQELNEPATGEAIEHFPVVSDPQNNVHEPERESDPEKHAIVLRNTPHKGQVFVSGNHTKGYLLKEVTLRLPEHKTSWNLNKSNGSIRISFGRLENRKFVLLSSQNLMAGATGNPGEGKKATPSKRYLNFKLPFPIYLEPATSYGFDLSISAGSNNYFEWEGSIKDSYSGGNAYLRNGLEVTSIKGDRSFRLSLEKLSTAKSDFQHPGTLHSQSDLKRMRNMIQGAKEPWTQSFELLQKSPLANLGWPAHPVEFIVRGVGRQNYTRVQQDGQAIYQLALMWHLTGEKRYANHAVKIANSWPPTLKGVTGNSNLSLAAGIVGYLFAIGADLLSTYPDWKPEDKTAFKEMMVRVFYTANHDFLYRKHGTFERFDGNTHYRMNWDSSNIASMAAIGILCDNRAIFNQALEFFKYGASNGRLERSAWYIHPNGMAQTEEMGRDQPHNLFGWYAHLLTCQMAWNQGVDLFSHANFRVLRAIEYIAKYNLDYPVKSVYHRNTSLKYTERLSEWHRGSFIPMFELVVNHYVNIKGMAAPYSEMAAAKIRPEPFPQVKYHPSQVDWYGLGTLTFTRELVADPVAPQKLQAHWHGTTLTLNWLGTARAKTYAIWKAEHKSDVFKKIAVVTSPEMHFTDQQVKKGSAYDYKISAMLEDGRQLTSEILEVKQQLMTQYKFEKDFSDSVSEFHGEDQGGSTGGPSFSEGIKGQHALDLDGVDDYVKLPDGIANYQDLTLSAWVYWRGGPAWQRVFDFGSEIEKYLMFTPSNGKESCFTITTSRGTDGSGVLKGPVLETNKWTHVAISLNGDCGTLYLNGRPVDSREISEVDPLFSQVYCYLGKSMYSHDPYLNGKIDEFRIYNHALSGSEVYRLFNEMAKVPLGFTQNPIILEGAKQDQNFQPAAHTLSSLTKGSGLTYKKVIGPDWLHISSNGQISGVPNNENRGENIFVLRITNSEGVSDDTNLSVYVENVNDKPIWNEESIKLPEVTHGHAFSVSIKEKAFDPDAENISFQKLSGPDWVNVDADGRVHGKPPIGKGGLAKVDVAALDASSFISATSVTIPVFTDQLVSHFSFSEGLEDSCHFQQLQKIENVKFEDGAAVFDGQKSYLKFKDKLRMEVFSSYTICTWAKWKGGKVWQRIFDFGNSTSSFLFLTPKSPDGKIQFGIKHADYNYNLAGPEFQENTWMHFAITVSQAKVQLFINGQLYSEKKELLFDPAEIQPEYNYLGKSQYNDPLFNGELRDFSIYNYTLDQKTIESLCLK